MPRLKSTEPFIHPDCDLADCTFGAYTEIGKGTRMQNVDIGDYSYCDRYADLANAQVGKFANIASFVRIGATDHPLETASLHHFLYRSPDYWDDSEIDMAWFEKRRSRLCVIGHDTWIGHNAQIKPEVTIGHGAVVASGSIVTKDVDPYTIVAGTPARVLRLRQPNDIAQRMIAMAWWDWDHSTLRDRLDDFRSLAVAAFLEKYE